MGSDDFAADAPSLIVIEPDDRTAALVLAGLEAHYVGGSVERLSAVHHASCLSWGRVHLAVCGIDDSHDQAISVVEQILQRREDLPILLLVSESRIDYALHGLEKGACDYVIKADDLGHTVARAVEKNLTLWARQQRLGQQTMKIKQSLSAARERNRELEEAVLRFQTMAGTDPLTGLANRRAFGRAMDQAFAEAQRYDGQLACVMIDLDGFKQLNDTFGHPAGDRILERAARVLEANCRRSDVAARFGGDEFILLLPRTGEAEARSVAGRIQREFRALAQGEVDAKRLPRGVSMSVGLACLPRTNAVSPEQLVAAADHALYRAKQGDKARLAVFGHPSRTGQTLGIEAGPLRDQDQRMPA